MLFSEFLKQVKSCPLQVRPNDCSVGRVLPPLYIFTGPVKQVSELKERGLQMLATMLTGTAAGADPVRSEHLGDNPTIRSSKSLSALGGLDSGASNGADTIKRFDMMNFNESEFWTELYAVPFLNQTRLVLLNIAERMDFIGKIDKQLKEYLSSKLLFTRLIIFIDKWEGVPVDLNQSVGKKAWVIECKPISDEDLPRWIAGQLNIFNKKISSADARLLAEKTGNDLARIDAVLEKLVIFHKDSQTISTESIYNFVDTERDFDIKELTNAIINRQPDRALKIVHQLLKKGDPVNKILGFLRGAFTYNARYQNNKSLLLSRYNKLLSTDLAIKTGRLPEDLALQLLVVKLTK